MKIIDKGFDKITRDIERMGKVVIAVGILQEDAGITYDNGASLGDVAHYNEYGTPNAPARPFMAGTAQAYEDKTLQVQTTQLRAVIDGTMTVGTAADQLGQWYQGRMQAHILNGPWAPNALSTVKAKGYAQPLMATKLMFNHIKYKVRP